MKKVMTPFGMMENHSTHPDAMGEEPKELTYEQKREKREKEWNKEMYIQGAFMGFIVGALYLAVMSSILEKL